MGKKHPRLPWTEADIARFPPRVLRRVGAWYVKKLRPVRDGYRACDVVNCSDHDAHLVYLRKAERGAELLARMWAAKLVAGEQASGPEAEAEA